MSDQTPPNGVPRVEWTEAERAALDRLRAAGPPADLEEAVGVALAARGRIASSGGGVGDMRVPRRRALGWAVLAAAACLAAFLAGRAISDRGAGVEPTVAMGTYMILLYEDASYRAPATPEAHAARVREYAAWAADLRERGIEIRGEELDPAGALEGPAGVLSGFFLLEVPSAEEADEIARTVPHLRHGGTVVVRRVVEH